MFPGFAAHTIEAGETTLFIRRKGSGRPLLLLHGFPQTHVMWHRVAPALAEHFTVIAADLPGYGDSVGLAPDGGDRFSKRDMANQLVASMSALGMSRFAVVGHDRGARVAYRMALDHPQQVIALGVLDVIPTLEVSERLTYSAARQMANWFFLAQASPVPEDIIGSRSDRYLRHILESWGGTEVIESETFEEYARCFRDPRVIRAICAEYRAGDSVDLEHDRVDRDTGRRIRCPVLVTWAPNGLVPLFGDPLSIWRKWANDVQGEAMNCRGHFMMEESPQETAERIHTFLAAKLQ